MKIIKINVAQNFTSSLTDMNQMVQANSSLDACGCTGNGQC